LPSGAKSSGKLHELVLPDRSLFAAGSAGRNNAPAPMPNKFPREMIQGLAILIVDDNAFMCRQRRTMLMNLGAKPVYEASDGLAALETVHMSDP